MLQDGRLYSAEIQALGLAQTSDGDCPTNGLAMFLIDGKSPDLGCTQLKTLCYETGPI